MTFISYGQNFEDVILWRALKHIESGFYIDVGANDPQDDSITKAFYDRGWHGINIEPLSRYHDALCAKRARDINLAVAAGADDGEITLFDLPDMRGWATSDAAIAQGHTASGLKVEASKVPVRTLKGICAEHVRGPIHFLKIDVEGFEGEVVKGMDFSAFRPWVLVVEATLPGRQVSNHAQWEPTLLAADYAFAYFDGLNRYYVAAEHGELLPAFATQPNVFDDFVTDGQIRANDAMIAAETALTFANHAVASTQTALANANAELANANTELANANAGLANANAGLATANAGLAMREKELATATHAMLIAENDLARTSEALFVTEENLIFAAVGKQKADAETKRAQAEVQRAHAEIQRAQAEVHHVHALMQAEKTRAAQFAEKAHQAEERTREALHQVHVRQTEIEAIHATLSWRITRPLRLIKFILREPRIGWQKIRQRLTLLKPVIKKCISRTIHWALRRPRLVRMVGSALSLTPALDAKVREITSRAKQEAAPLHVPVVDPTVPGNLRHVPLSTRKILADLQHANANAKT